MNRTIIIIFLTAVFSAASAAVFWLAEFPSEPVEIAFVSPPPVGDAEQQISDLVAPLAKSAEVQELFDSSAALKAISELPWVKYAAVRKTPSAIKITVEPRKFIGSLKSQQVFYPVEEGGAVIPASIGKVFYPTVDTVETAKNLPAMQRILEPYPTLASSVLSAKFVDSLRWDIVFSSGLRLRLPQENPENKLKELVYNGLFAKRLKVIDARANAQIFVKVE